MLYFLDQIKVIFSDMMNNKLRIFLTMSGTIIGVLSVIVIISVGEAASSSVNNFFTGTLGTNTLTSYISFTPTSDYEKYLLTYDELNTMAAKIDGAVGALVESPDTVYGSTTVNSDKYASGAVKGVTPAYQKGTNVVMIKGRFINENDCMRVASTAVVSDIFAVNCYGSVDNAIGKTFVLRNGTVNIEASIVGVYRFIDTQSKLEYTDDIREIYTNIYCPYEYVNNCTHADPARLKYYSATIVCDNNANMYRARKELHKLMLQRSSDIEYSVSTHQVRNDVDYIKSIIQTITLVFIFAAALSLLTGGITLMNTLLVTVRERTKEIGIMKAIGASRLRIVLRFLFESIVICLTACFIGIVAGYVMVYFLDQNIRWFIELIPNDGLRMFLSTNGISVGVNPSSLLTSTAFSVSIGLIFGIYPALKAAMMQVTDALRYE